MLFYGIRFSNFKIENGDIFEWDVFGDIQFDVVVVNFLFLVEWSVVDKFNIDDCFSKVGWFVLCKIVDYVFILYMIYYLNEGGIMVCVVLYGVLF